MVIDLKDLKKLRSKLGVSQVELSQMADVSQSMIAKIEAGRIDPSYSKAKRIINSLELVSKKGVKASDVMVKRIISVSPHETLTNTVKKMKKYEISQLLVLDSRNPVGYVSESIILATLMENGSKQVYEIMQDVPPIVNKDASLTVVSQLLQFYQMVVVSDRGRPVGIVTRADVIRRI